MTPGLNSAGADAVFPALDIIRRAGPPDEFRDDLYEQIVKYLHSSVWHVREMAARTLCSCLLHDGWIEAIKEIVQGAQSDSSKNRLNSLHGCLLVLRFTIEKLADVMPLQLASKLTPSPKDLILTTGLDDLPRLKPVLKALAKHVWAQRPAHPDILAAHLEVLNALSRFELGSAEQSLDDVGKVGSLIVSGSDAEARSALLKLQLGIQQIYQSAALGDMKSLTRSVVDISRTSPNTATAMLESIPKVMSGRLSVSASSQLSELYIEACLHAITPDVRSTALQNLADSLDYLLEHEALVQIPATPSLLALWRTVESRPLGPNLSEAIIRASGPIMAAFVTRESEDQSLVSSRVAPWGLMMADAGLDDKVSAQRLLSLDATLTI